VTTAPDGSPVELYLLLPPGSEAELIDGSIDAGAEILELGCGVGRVTHELLRLGHPVVAVDESAEMLTHVRGAQTVRAKIEELELGRRFPCVLLMSNLVNTDDAQRAGFLAACARHVASDGVVLIERHEPGWRPTEGVRRRLGDVLVSLEDVRIEPPHVGGTVRYEVGGRTWQHSFEARILDDDELGASLAEAGLELAQVLDDAGRWVAARPILAA
jgi:SAM-dependent methyltransferase